MELVTGAVLGVVFDQLRNEIWRVMGNGAMFKSKLEQLELTLELLSPVIQEIEELNIRLNNRSDHGRETIVLMRLLEDGKKLVSECSNIPRWDILKRSRHREKLVELDNKILRFHCLHMSAHISRDQKKALLFMQEMSQMMTILLNQQQGDSSNLTMALTDLKRNLLSVQEMSQMMIMLLNQQQGDSSNLTMELTASSSIDSSGLTMSLTASSTDPFHKVQQKIVMKVHMDCDGCRRRVVRLASITNGVSSVAIEGDEKDIMVVTGHGVDAVDIINRLRKRYPAGILSITDA